MVDSAHGLWVAVGLLHLLFQWHFGAMDIANTNLSKLYLHEDDRTSYLRHTIGKLFLRTFDTIPTRNGRELGEIWVSKVGTNF